MNINGISGKALVPTTCSNSRADSRFVPSQWETSLQSNAVSHWPGANLESALELYIILSIHLWTCIPGFCADCGNICTLQKLDRLCKKTYRLVSTYTIWSKCLNIGKSARRIRQFAPWVTRAPTLRIWCRILCKHFILFISSIGTNTWCKCGCLKLTNNIVFTKIDISVQIMPKTYAYFCSKEFDHTTNVFWPIYS